MEFAELRSRRLFAHGLRGPGATDAPSHPPASTPAGIVRRAVAVQSQEYLPAQWGLAQRLPAEHRPDAASVAAAIDRGEILRTHVLRPTWHFVHPGDARWLVGLSAARVHRQNGTPYRQNGIDADVAARALDLISRLVDGGHRTRPELQAALAAAGLPSRGVGLASIVMYAELERVVISGVSVGRQRTYAPFDERVPPASARDPADALAELAERFLGTRSPATARDFATWSGFTLGDARRALADAADRTGRRIEPFDAAPGGGAGPDDLWHDASVSAAWMSQRDAGDATHAPDDPARVDLLQAYDEYIMGYAAPRAFLQSALHSRNPIISEFPLHALMIGGAMAGRWAPTVQGPRATVRIVPWRRFTRAEARSRDASIAEVERFLGVPVKIELEPVSRA